MSAQSSYMSDMVTVRNRKDNSIVFEGTTVEWLLWNEQQTMTDEEKILAKIEDAELGMRINRDQLRTHRRNVIAERRVLNAALAELKTLRRKKK